VVLQTLDISKESFSYNPKFGILFTRAAKNTAYLGLVRYVANPYGLSGTESV
jgi:hypothetical protein